jgi:hypothetical protein
VSCNARYNCPLFFQPKCASTINECQFTYIWSTVFGATCVRPRGMPDAQDCNDISSRVYCVKQRKYPFTPGRFYCPEQNEWAYADFKFCGEIPRGFSAISATALQPQHCQNVNERITAKPTNVNSRSASAPSLRLGYVLPSLSLMAVLLSQ